MRGNLHISIVIFFIIFESHCKIQGDSSLGIDPINQIPKIDHLFHPHINQLKMNRLIIRIHTRLLECLAQRRVCMTSPCDILRTRPILHAQNALGNHLSRIRSHDVHTQNLVCRLVREDLHISLPISRGIGPRPRVGHERKRSLIECHTGLLELLFCLSHRCHLREGVYDSRDGVVVHVSSEARDGLHGCDTLLLGLVCKHGPINTVSNGVDGWDSRSEVGVDIDSAEFVGLNSQIFQSESLRVWSASSGYQNNIIIFRLLIAALRRFRSNSHSISHNLALHHLRLELKLETLLL
mmetsp:Transcript_9771/g.17641  ORF Transcript_9771/g.17641 Transcript_9771/m.17641 type:complete len:295 (+) Transcript_9771:40-924(+)